LLGIGLELVAHQPPQPGLAAQDLLQRAALGRQLILLAADLHLLELRQVPQLQFRIASACRSDRPKVRHQHRLGLVLAADDADHLVDVQVGDQQAVEHVQPRLDLVQPVLEPAPSRCAVRNSSHSPAAPSGPSRAAVRPGR
jgi:hypothetical protein